ncbi:DegT/DnrJ/EryC1/StrS family aminotransferase [Synechococcus sp. AH-551-A10]|nr:DegT/DnrJ/EryC1/StrS family aminotransferase [Synechococcus sp. AH-551-A10]MDB4682074.1 DegT/DnrJ/EryC1/StrS family aminotransferase [Synechococcus sp. AH-551-A10]
MLYRKSFRRSALYITDKKFLVTKPFLPPLDEVHHLMERIWEKSWVTNQGYFHQMLEEKLAEYLNIDHISLFSSGTTSLITAIKASGLKGEVITTPYSFVATSHSIAWNGLEPVFADIEAETLNIDPKSIEENITEKTTAIVAVHCYGNPCDVEAIESIANRHNLKLIYDGAHAFGVNCHCGSIFSHGDYSITSFHATKVFNTFEGGAIISNSKEDKQYIDLLRNFGYKSETEIVNIGINGKMSEFNAALGVVQLRYIDKVLKEREYIYRRYTQNLNSQKGIKLIKFENSMKHNYSYMPILITEESKRQRDEVYDELKRVNIFTRRYFYPLISDLKPHSQNKRRCKLPNATTTSSSILCLPIYPGLKMNEVDYISDHIIRLCVK